MHEQLAAAMRASRQQMSESMQGASDARDPSSYTVAEIQAVVLKPRKIILTTSAGRDCNVAR